MSYMSASLVPRQGIDLDGPAIPAPEGYTSMLDNPPNSNYIAIPIITLCVVLAAISFVTRFYAKFLGKKLNVADYLTFAAFPVFWVYVYYTYRLSWTGGYLVHLWDMRLGNTPAFSYITFIGTLLYLWIVALIKCAILLEWVDIFVPKGERGYFSWACYATCFAFCALSIIIFILDLVNCTPYEGNWNSLIPGVVCRFGIPQFGLASSTTNFTLDLIPLCLSQKVIWSLHLSWKKKIGVSFIFLFGLAGCAASLIRLYYSTRFYVSNDISYYFSILAITSLAETTAAILVLCVPFMPKALLGLSQTKPVKALRSYKSLKSESTYVNSSDSHYNSQELGRVKKNKEHWFMSSRLADNATARSYESERPLQNTDIA
ncbi:hypothetical protein F5Y12DRAFT_720941 [Xylaria sp. FL1777]|nr:hypothetical protein F5Y12DRAFT_720941 [Xylaria sp. FL1777]